MRVFTCAIILAFLASCLVFLPSLTPLQAVTTTYTCRPFSCYNTTTGMFRYTSASCNIVCDQFGCFAGALSCDGPECTIETSNPSNTNYTPNPDARCLPGGQPINTGCQQGFYYSNIPTCSGGEGGGTGDCPAGCLAADPACTALAGGAACPQTYVGRQCRDVPCGWRPECGCGANSNTGCRNNCSAGCNIGACGAGGGSSPTPTPTPAPTCELACPGNSIKDLSGHTFIRNNQKIADLVGGSVNGATTLLAQGAGGGAGGGAVTTFHACGDVAQAQGKDPNTISYGFGEVTGNLTYNGYNSFECAGVYSCPLNPANPETCPVPTITQGGGDGSGILGAHTKKQSSFGKVLGAISDKLLAQGAGGGAGGAGGASGGTTSGFSSTWTRSETINRLDGSEPTLYGYTVANNTGQSCSCQVVLGCQESQQLSPNSESMASGDCDTQCNFTFRNDGSELPELNETVTMDVEANDGFDVDVQIDYDDGTNDTLTGPYAQDITHSFTDAGTYDVTLTCQNNGNNTKTCTRHLNVYCEGTDPENLPTPTPTPPGAWMKMSNTSIQTRSALANPAPTGAVAYDATDILSCDAGAPDSRACVVSGKAGVVISHGTASYGTRLSEPQWLREDSSYTTNTTFEPDTFIEYARARKDVNDVQSVDTSELQVNTINIYTGNITITDNDLPDFLQTGQTMLIVVDGNVTFNIGQPDGRIFNPDNKPFALIVTGEIEIASATEELNGIFVANTADFAYDAFPDTDTPLKINGTFSTMATTTPCNSKRQRTDNELMPSCYFKTDLAGQTLPLWSIVSNRTYEWSEPIN